MGYLAHITLHFKLKTMPLTSTMNVKLKNKWPSIYEKKNVPAAMLTSSLELLPAD